ncbi:hypothetical protein AB6919_003525 [Vibrio cholerae]|nr:hypothetical protein [Vibrio cholerae]EJL6488849.1 hypothetical protein [Vibrio cholerae]EJL6586810.1 hypothetical protein [Vibrio cholerae]EJL6891258.1 hypothetical protein [Vibrio cholerae]EKF9426918.1 hypothetical protein [Vibrio cholerae]
MVTVVVFEFSGMRCQPLRRALYGYGGKVAIESKSKIKFKKNLIKQLPFFPDDKNTLQLLNDQSLSEVVLHYLHWQTRQVPARVRKVHIYAELTSDKRYRQYKNEIYSLLNIVREGKELTPFLSARAVKKGYTPSDRVTSGEVDSWADKDQILNTKGFHHFHLSMDIQKSGFSVRTDVVLFALVTRDSFHAVALFDHSVFNSEKITLEQERMWNLHSRFKSIGMEPGAVYFSNPIMLSGHPLYLVRLSQQYMRFIHMYDPQLNDRSLVNELYGQGKLQPPNKYKLEWCFEALDLIIKDTKNEVNFVIFKGSI